MKDDYISKEEVTTTFAIWLARKFLPHNFSMWREVVELVLKDVRFVQSERWIPCSKKLPEMHDAGRILKEVGIKQRSEMVYITIEEKRNDGGVERITDADAELRDGEWYSDTLRWLKAAGKKIEVTAWMPYPEPYRPEGDDKHEG